MACTAESRVSFGVLVAKQAVQCYYYVQTLQRKDSRVTYAQKAQLA